MTAEPPDPPTDVIITDIDKHAITLTWEPPKYDGGSPVTGYVVERLDPSTGIWRYAQSVPRPTCTVSCLDEHTEHKFRIMADASGLFSTDGESLMASETLDYERDPARQFVITVQVTDDGTPPMTVSVTGTVVAVFTSFL